MPGLYGYVSATKWMTEIELTTLGGLRRLLDPAGLVQGGADPDPVADRHAALGSGRAERPGAGRRRRLGADARHFQGRGRARRATTTGTSASCQLRCPNYTWVQWQTTLPRRAGQHTIRVRATDGTGAVQESRVTPPAPDGARGYHTVTFSAT